MCHAKQTHKQRHQQIQNSTSEAQKHKQNAAVFHAGSSKKVLRRTVSVQQ